MRHDDLGWHDKPMNPKGGLEKASLKTLPPIKDRLSFLYLERCLINRQSGAITITDVRGTVHVPASILSVLMLGPGCNITHRAMELLGNAGSTILWVGEMGVRYYAHARPLTHSSRLIMQQAFLVSGTRTRVAVARKMYALRFPGEQVDQLTMQQLRGREGARIRSVYRKMSAQTGVPWNKRDYDIENFSGSDPINQALSAAHSCLYGLVHSIIVALGCSPALGFVHTGHERSFVYDMADLYKAELTIPLAFEVAADPQEDIGAQTRRRVRDALQKSQIIKRTIDDLYYLLFDEKEPQYVPQTEILYLWDEKGQPVASAVSYGKGEPEDEPAVGYGHSVRDEWFSPAEDGT